MSGLMCDDFEGFIVLLLITCFHHVDVDSIQLLSINIIMDLQIHG